MLFKSQSNNGRQSWSTSTYSLAILGLIISGIFQTRDAAAQTFELNVACPSKYCVSRFNSLLHGPCMVNDSCMQTNATTSCDQPRPRMITPQEMLADLSYKLDTQFEVVYADQEKFLKQMAELQQQSGDHSKQLAQLLEEMKKSQEAHALHAKFFESISASIKGDSDKHHAELAKKIDENSKAYQQHIKRLTERSRVSEARILSEMDKTFDVVKSISEGLINVMKKATDNTESILGIIQKADGQFKQVRKNQERNGKLISGAAEKIDQTHQAFHEFSEKTDGQLRALEHDHEAQHEQLENYSDQLAASRKGILGIQKQLRDHSEKSGGLLRALEHDLQSITERIANLEKSEQKRQKQLMQRLQRLDDIEARLSTLEPKQKSRKKKK